jgi:hypothetical protein
MMKNRNSKESRKKLRKRNQFSKQKSTQILLTKRNAKEIIFDKVCMSEYNNSKTLENSKLIKFIPSYKTLPTEIITDLQNFSQKYQLYSNQCYANSNLISFNIENVEVVHGWLGFKYSEFDDEIAGMEITNFYKNPTENDSEFKYVEYYIPTPYGKVFRILDLKNKINYTRHCWNKFKGVNFDITIEPQSHIRNKRWSYYKEIQSFESPFLLEKVFSKNIFTDFIYHYFDKKGCQKLNVS